MNRPNEEIIQEETPPKNGSEKGKGLSQIFQKLLAHKIMLIVFVGALVLGIAGASAVLLLVVMPTGGKGAEVTTAAHAEEVDDHGTPVKASEVAKPTASKPVVKEPVKEASKTSEKTGKHIGPTFRVKDRIINLADPGGRRYLRISLALEFKVSDPEMAKALVAPGEEKVKKLKVWEEEAEAWAPIIEDQITTVLTGRTFAEVASSEGKDAIKSEIKERINEHLPSDKVTNVYITDFVIQ